MSKRMLTVIHSEHGRSTDRISHEGPYGGLGVKPNFVQFGNAQNSLQTAQAKTKAIVFKIFASRKSSSGAQWRNEAPFFMPMAQCNNLKHVTIEFECCEHAKQSQKHCGPDST